MPNINLISARRAEKKKVELWTRQLFFGLSGSVGAFILLVSYLGVQRLSMAGELAQANELLRSLKPKKDRVQELKRDKEDLAPKVETLQKAKLDTLRWKALLQVVSQSIPPDTWLSSITASGTDTATVLRLNGFTATQTSAAQTVLNLQTHPLFEKVDIGFTNQVPGNPGDPTPRVNFEIDTTLKGSTPPKDDKKPGGTINAEKRQAEVNKVTLTLPSKATRKGAELV